MEKWKLRVFNTGISLTTEINNCFHEWDCSSSSSNTCWAMHNCSLIILWFQIPSNKMIKHWFKICESLILWNSMIWPTIKMNLSDISCCSLSIVDYCLKFSSHQVLAFFKFCNSGNSDFFIIICILCNWKLHRLALWPKSVALCSSVFFGLASTDDTGDIIFNYHLPEVLSCIW